ncbi:hypothetical protein [Nevskia soli]|uniref:hypothetical protein n=1 Tax=Nevskia soli TaxID=418856 RepID=UPI0004A6C9F4|nr:hypothetical protein [Nevskia soli]
MARKKLAEVEILTSTVLGYDEFEMDVEQILRSQLPGFFKDLAVAPLTLEHIEKIPVRAKGAYVLYENSLPVYAGKTDSRHGFRDRLSRHFHTIQNRRNMDPAHIGFKAVRIMVFSNFDVETILIEEMRRLHESYLAWNTSGFGSNDPGRRREGQESAEFDSKHPIDVDRPLDFVEAGTYDVLGLLVLLKEKLPYLLRFETDGIGNNSKGTAKNAKYTVGHVDQRSTFVTVPAGGVLSMRQLMRLIVSALPTAQWQATIFPDRVILYKENNKEYLYAIDTI